ncbi:DNA-3-methyladenine glycosylase [Austwickia chelonae]|uniref:DNA-3-methyladenine glycosylase n=1 Tax=Austwickia chelonae TaxID=100225 RepID=UPI000E2410B3
MTDVFLTERFYARPVLEVARDLLGCVIAHSGVAVRLTEVEAYDGEHDPGSHAFRGRTPRTEAMYGPPGGLYVYFAYGMHFCANLVCRPEGQAAGVLLRAGEVVAGETVAVDRRMVRKKPSLGPDRQAIEIRPRDLACGPARLTTCLAIGRAENGLLTTSEGSAVKGLFPIDGVGRAAIMRQ